MLRLRYTKDDKGKSTVLLGLSRKNIELLMQGRPIAFDAAGVGLKPVKMGPQDPSSAEIVICFGETEGDIARDLGLEDLLKGGFDPLTGKRS